MKHVFIMKSEGTTHSFIPVIHEVMAGLDYDIHISQYKDHASKIMNDYKENVRVYSVGGDGFLNQVVQAVVNTDHELVVIPYGTGNDFSRYVNKQEKDPKQVLIQSLENTSSLIDTIKMNDIYYVNSGCFGIDSVIACSVHENSYIPFKKEGTSYKASVLKNIAGYKFVKMKLMSEGKLLYDGKITLATANNGQYYGGGFHITPDASITDGYMDVLVVDEINKLHAAYYISKILTKRIAHTKKSHTFRVRELDVYTDGIGNFDGEETPQSHYHLEVNADSLRLVYQKD